MNLLWGMYSESQIYTEICHHSQYLLQCLTPLVILDLTLPIKGMKVTTILEDVMIQIIKSFILS